MYISTHWKGHNYPHSEGILCIQTSRRVEVEANHTSALATKSVLACFFHTEQCSSPYGFIITFSPAIMNRDTVFHIWPKAPKIMAGINLLLLYANS